MRFQLALIFTLALSHVALADSIETLAVVRHLDEVEVPARRDGLIRELNVRRGERVSAKALIAHLDETDLHLLFNVAKAQLKQAQARAENVGPIDAAKIAVARAEQEQKLLEELGEDAVYLERFRTKNNLLRVQAEQRAAENLLLQDRLQVAVKQHEAMVLENDIRQMAVQSPVDGVVRDLLKHQGEWVQQGDAIAVITRMDQLLVEGFLDSSVVPPHEITSGVAKVTFELKGLEPMEFGNLAIKQVAPKLELDGKFPVWVTIKNRLVKDRSGNERWLIRPGMSAKMEIELR